MSRVSTLWSGLSSATRRGIVGGSVGLLGLGVVAAVALGGGGKSAARPLAATTTTAAPTTSTTTTTAPPGAPVAPLTGLPATDTELLKRPALAVKIDNLDVPRESAVPQTGLPKTDVVYEEIVEGDITRLVGIFHSQTPGKVGPIRSARTTDVELLPILGRPLLAWSGGNQGVTAAVQGSPYIINVGWDSVPGAYARDGSRKAPHNLYAESDQLWAAAPKDLPAPGALFQYRKAGQANPPTAVDAQGVDITWGGGAASSPVSWRWDPKAKVYVRDQHGRPHLDSGGAQLTATNVVVQVTEYGQSAADLRSPEAHTIGAGELMVFTNGTFIHGNWNRPDITKPAVFTDDKGKPILLTPGNTWVELPRVNGAFAIRG